MAQAGLTLQDALDAYARRYRQQASDLYHVIRALTYFADAERDAVMPRGLTAAEWERIKAWCQDHAAKLLLRE